MSTTRQEEEMKSTKIGAEPVTVRLSLATNLPEKVEANIEEIAEWACHAAFAHIAQEMRGLGYPVTGDFGPGETRMLDEVFAHFVRSMALNNDTIGAMQGDDAPVTI